MIFYLSDIEKLVSQVRTVEIITGLITQQLLWRKYNQKYLKVTI